MSKEEESDIRKYLKEIGMARERGGAVYEEALPVGGTVKGAAIKMAELINRTMRARETDVVSVNIHSLPRLFGMNVIDPLKTGRSIRIKKSVKEHLKARGIQIRYSKRAGIVDFMKIEEKKY